MIITFQHRIKHGHRQAWLTLRMEGRYALRLHCDADADPRTAHDALYAALRPLVALFEHNSHQYLVDTFGTALINRKSDLRDLLRLLIQNADQLILNRL